MVLRSGSEAIEGLRGRGARIGFKMPLNAEVDQRIGLFASRGHNTARSVVFERAAHEHLVIG